MAYTSGFTAVSGATFTAAQYNTYVRDNFTAVWVWTTAGDIVYATSATALARLGKPASIGVLSMNASGVPSWLVSSNAHSFLRWDGSAMSFAPLIYKRQGGSSTVWTSPGTTNYTPTRTKPQLGYIGVTVSSGAGTKDITYPEAYTTERPAIFFTMEWTTFSPGFSIGHSNDTLTGFRIELKFDSSVSGTYTVGWKAEGGY